MVLFLADIGQLNISIFCIVCGIVVELWNSQLLAYIDKTWQKEPDYQMR